MAIKKHISIYIACAYVSGSDCTDGPISKGPSGSYYYDTTNNASHISSTELRPIWNIECFSPNSYWKNVPTKFLPFKPPPNPKDADLVNLLCFQVPYPHCR